MFARPTGKSLHFLVPVEVQELIATVFFGDPAQPTAVVVTEKVLAYFEGRRDEGNAWAGWVIELAEQFGRRLEFFWDDV